MPEDAVVRLLARNEGGAEDSAGVLPECQVPAARDGTLRTISEFRPAMAWIDDLIAYRKAWSAGHKAEVEDTALLTGENPLCIQCVIAASRNRRAGAALVR